VLGRITPLFGLRRRKRGAQGEERGYGHAG
jgi:hypothetical protein